MRRLGVPEYSTAAGSRFQTEIEKPPRCVNEKDGCSNRDDESTSVAFYYIFVKRSKCTFSQLKSPRDLMFKFVG